MTPARGVFISPTKKGTQGLYLAEHSTEPGSLFFLPRDRSLGCFGLTYEAAREVHSHLSAWLHARRCCPGLSGATLPLSRDLVEIERDGVPGFAEVEEDTSFALAGEPEDAP